MDYPNYETLEIQCDGPVMHVRLNRPDKRNAFNGEVVADIKNVFTAINEDEATRVVVLSGNGKSFSAGADLPWMIEQAGLDEASNEQSASEMAGMFLSVARCNKPVVVRIHGHALGGGTGLTAAADIAIATDTTWFGLTEVKLGIVPAVISPFVMEKIGVGRARTLFLTGERFDGKEAERIGLVHRSVPEADLDAEVTRVVGELLSSGPAAVVSAKKLIEAVAPLSLEDAIPKTSKWIASVRSTPEAKEGMSAFLDKRKPGWMNREGE
jgi:methylglutaconyl-CoA hydratase